MSAINLLLTDRASISRGETQIVNGSQKVVWSVVATGVPTAFVRQTYLESYVDTTVTASRSSGAIYFAPDANVKAGDIATLSDGTKITVLGAGGPQKDHTGNISHLEFAGKQA